MALKKCKECGAEISSSAKTCPQCGKKQKNIKGIIVAIILFCICCGILFGEDSSNPTNNNEIKPVSTTPTENFTLVSDEMITDGYGYSHIDGTIQNNTNKTYSYVQVTFNLYDAQGNQIGSAMDNINNLEGNSTWKYSASALLTENIASYKFVEITGW